MKIDRKGCGTLTGFTESFWVTLDYGIGHFWPNVHVIPLLIGPPVYVTTPASKPFKSLIITRWEPALCTEWQAFEAVYLMVGQWDKVAALRHSGQQGGAAAFKHDNHQHSPEHFMGSINIGPLSLILYKFKPELTSFLGDDH